MSVIYSKIRLALTAKYNNGMRGIYKQLLLVSLLGMGYMGHGQENATSWKCTSLQGKMGAAAAKTTIADPAEDKYDVKYLKFDLAVTNTSAYITGDVTTVAEVVAATMPTYVFELKAPMVIDSAMVDGVTLPVVTTGDVQTITLPAALPAGTVFTARVIYHGTPTAATAFFAPGLSTATSPTWGNHVTYTLSESYKAKDWWPCKQSLTDKIDSVDMWVTVPDSLKVGSNGILQAVTHVDATHDRYEWKERIPVDYYLISLSAAAYVDYSFYAHYTGSTDSTLVQNYIYDNPATLPFFKSVIDSTSKMLDYFSVLYGRYPFWQEKYGHSMAPLGGGMEHQTMTTLGYFNGPLVAHELAHQWFGDNVTCASWADIAVNEGFAAYSEYLYKDHFWNHTAATADIIDRQDHVMEEAGGTLYVNDTTDENRIFSSRLTYDKGACMLHTLRSIVRDDSLFFQVYRLYQGLHSNGNGTITTFRDAAIGYLGATVNGIRLDTFFNQWAYREGFPIYTVNWNQIGSDVYVRVDQTTSVPSSVPVFTLPVEIKLRSATGDTVVRAINDAASQVYHFTWDRTMFNVVLDPNAWITDSVTSIGHDVTLNTGVLSAPTMSIYPNPTTDSWMVIGAEAGSTLMLTDMAGRVLWQGTTGAGSSCAVPARDLATGMYLLRVSAHGVVVKTSKLVKK